MKAATQAQQRQRLLRRSLIHFQNLCAHPYSGHNFFYTRSWASINDELECRGSAVCVLPSSEDVVRHADAHKLVEWQKCSPGVGGTLPRMTNRKLVMLSNNTNSTLQVWVRADHSGYRKLFINAAKKQFEFGRYAHDDAANYLDGLSKQLSAQKGVAALRFNTEPKPVDLIWLQQQLLRLINLHRSLHQRVLTAQGNLAPSVSNLSPIPSQVTSVLKHPSLELFDCLYDADHTFSKAALRNMKEAWVRMCPVPALVNRRFGSVVESHYSKRAANNGPISFGPEQLCKVLSASTPHSQTDSERVLKRLGGIVPTHIYSKYQSEFKKTLERFHPTSPQFQ